MLSVDYAHLFRPLVTICDIPMAFAGCLYKTFHRRESSRNWQKGWEIKAWYGTATYVLHSNLVLEKLAVGHCDRDGELCGVQ